jgi:hypothetical protein
MGQDLKISQLPPVVVPLSSDVVPVVNDGLTRKITLHDVNSFGRAYTHANFLPLSGGTITGNLGVNGNLDVGSDVTIVGGLSVFGDTTYLDTQIVATSAIILDTETNFDAVRITQRGLGNAFYVEDINSPDLSPFVIRNDGRVGVGTNTPTQRLSIEGNTTITENLSVGGEIQINSGRLVNVYHNDLALLDPADRSFRVFLSGDEKFAILNNGNTGVGTSTPEVRLDVNGDAIIRNDLEVKGNLSVLGTTTQLDTLVYATSALDVINAGTGPAATIKQTGDEPVAHFLDDNETALFIDGKTATPGFVGVGTDAPHEKLTVVGNITASNIIYADGGNSVEWNYGFDNAVYSISGTPNQIVSTKTTGQVGANGFTLSFPDSVAFPGDVHVNANLSATYISTPGGDSVRWNDNSTVVETTSARWNDNSTMVETNSAIWNSAYGILSGNTLSVGDIQLTNANLNLNQCLTWANTKSLSSLLITINGVGYKIPLLIQ